MPYYEPEHIVRHIFFTMLYDAPLDEIIKYYNKNNIILSNDDKARIPCLLNYEILNTNIIEWCIDVLGVDPNHINRYVENNIDIYYGRNVYQFLIKKYYRCKNIPIRITSSYYSIEFLYGISPESFTNNVWYNLLARCELVYHNRSLTLWILKKYNFNKNLNINIAVKILKKLYSWEIYNRGDTIVMFYLMLYSKRYKKCNHKYYPLNILRKTVQKKMKIFI